MGLMSPTEPQSGYMPIFRSGSWSEMGTKSYMEDEHVCIDNLVEHLNASPSFPAPGAFYGVSHFIVFA
jgi:protein phosphatase PTC2/3